MSNGLPSITEINNGVANTTFGMPKKDITSDNDSTYEMNRALYMRTYAPITSVTKNRTVIQRNALGLGDRQAVVSSTATALQKKWIGGNRDASQVATQRRVDTTGAVLNAKTPFSFKNVKNANDRIDALARVRGGGAANVPKAVTKY